MGFVGTMPSIQKGSDITSEPSFLECFSSLSYVVIFLKIVLTSAKLIKN